MWRLANVFEARLSQGLDPLVAGSLPSNVPFKVKKLDLEISRLIPAFIVPKLSFWSPTKDMERLNVTTIMSKIWSLSVSQKPLLSLLAYVRSVVSRELLHGWYL
jgi:hypothetical protein